MWWKDPKARFSACLLSVLTFFYEYGGGKPTHHLKCSDLYGTNLIVYAALPSYFTSFAEDQWCWCHEEVNGRAIYGTQRELLCANLTPGKLTCKRDSIQDKSLHPKAISSSFKSGCLLSFLSASEQRNKWCGMAGGGVVRTPAGINDKSPCACVCPLQLECMPDHFRCF